jgi:hypothetical protein
MNGGYYYGDNNQCEPTDCVNGWHLKTSMSGSELATAIGTGAGTSHADIRNNGSFSENSASYGQSYYGISDNNTWATDYGTKGMLIGQARCSTRGVTNPWKKQNGYTFDSDHFVSSLTDETGQEGAVNCYCNVTGYKDGSGNMQSLSSSWVFNDDNYGGASGCANACANSCSIYMRDAGSIDLALRAAVLGSVQPGLASCEANTITINWSDASAADISANNAGTATYGSDVRTPVKATTKKGKTFRGWRFSRPETTNLPE